MPTLSVHILLRDHDEFQYLSGTKRGDDIHRAKTGGPRFSLRVGNLHLIGVESRFVQRQIT